MQSIVYGTEYRKSVHEDGRVAYCNNTALINFLNRAVNLISHDIVYMKMSWEDVTLNLPLGSYITQLVWMNKYVF